MKLNELKGILCVDFIRLLLSNEIIKNFHLSVYKIDNKDNGYYPVEDLHDDIVDEMFTQFGEFYVKSIYDSYDYEIAQHVVTVEIEKSNK